MTRKPWSSGDDDPTLRIEEGDPRSIDDLARTKRLPPAPQPAPAPRPMLPRFETTGSFTHLRDRPPPLDNEPVTVKNVDAVHQLPPPPRIPGRYPSAPPIPPQPRLPPAPRRPTAPPTPRIPLAQAMQRPDPTLPILLKPRPAPPKVELARNDQTVNAPLSDPRHASQSLASVPAVSRPASHPSVPIATPTPPPTASSRPPLVIPRPDPPPLSAKQRILDALPRSMRALPFRGQASRAAAYGVGAALAVSIVFSMALFLALRSDNPESKQSAQTTLTSRPASPTLTTPASPNQAMVMTCGLARSGQLLTRALPGVLPMLAPAPGTARAAIGFASGRNRAEGIVVHLDNLTVERRFDEERNGSVFRVTPLTDRAPVAFAVDSDDSRARGTRTIPAQPPIRIGSSNFGIVRLDPGREPSVVWPGGNNEDNGEPAFAIAEKSTLVTFRRGRTSGEVLAGWLSASGTADSELGRVEAGARAVAAPAAAAGDGFALIVFPARAQNERWHLRVAKAIRGKLPTGSQVLEGAASGTSDATSPAIAALPNGGWVVQWIESTQSAKRLITQAYDEKLVPAGLPVEIASGALSEVPGGLVYKDGRVLAVYLTMNGGTSELWGVVLRCG